MEITKRNTLKMDDDWMNLTKFLLSNGVNILNLMHVEGTILCNLARQNVPLTSKNLICNLKKYYAEAGLDFQTGF